MAAAAAAASSFRVSWNSFPSHVLSALDNLRLDEDFVDVSIYCGRRLIKAHRNVLSASSNYFKEIFKSNPSSHPVVILCDVDHASLRSLVDFMYHGEIEVPTARLDRLLRLGELLQVQGISSHKPDAASSLQESLTSEEPTSPPPSPPPQPQAASSPGLHQSDVIAPECVITEPAGCGPGGRRRRRSRRRTVSSGGEAAVPDAATSQQAPLPVGVPVGIQAPPPLTSGPTTICGPGLPLPPAPAAHSLPVTAPGVSVLCSVKPEQQAPAGDALAQLDGGAPPPVAAAHIKSEWCDQPTPTDLSADAAKLLLDEAEQSGMDMSQYSGGIFGGGVGSRRPLTGAERARRYRERKKLKKLYEALLGGSPRREQLTVQL